ncbi:hypothetical protein CCMA1212_003509 [Trichoderma ghanense]|uniref:Uncharacterized protein n=1 Tax=Trichoderma ghanense TaxID=65468 RepID=A0ABY2H783_9HYPO
MSSGQSLPLLDEELFFPAVPEDGERDGTTHDGALSVRLRIMDKILEMRNRAGRFRLGLRKGPRYLENLHRNF